MTTKNYSKRKYYYFRLLMNTNLQNASLQSRITTHVLSVKSTQHMELMQNFREEKRKMREEVQHEKEKLLLQLKDIKNLNIPIESEYANTFWYYLGY